METITEKQDQEKKNNKNWLKAGIVCYHKDLGDIEVTIDRIRRKPIKAEPGRSLVVGVDCHWVIDGTYKKGTFHTKEFSPEPVKKDAAH